MYFLTVALVAFLLGFVDSAPPEPLCHNDFVRTMICTLSWHKNLNCTKYSVQFSPKSKYWDERFTCVFKEDTQDSCICTVEMMQFISGEEYDAKLFDGENIIHSYVICPSEHIKPKPPTIVSVNQKENGNLVVRWNGSYPESSYLFDSLKFQLSYKKKEDPEQFARTVNSSLPFKEILGSDVEENTVYVLKTRSFSDDYKTSFSEWSQEMEWTTPASTVTMLKIFIPFLCILLIFILCATYWATARMKAKWWDNIPKPSKTHLNFPYVKSKVNTLLLTSELSYTVYFPFLLKNHLTIDSVEGDLTHIKMNLDSGDSLLPEYTHTYQKENISSSTIQNRMHLSLEKALKPFFDFDAPSTNLDPAVVELYKNVDGTALRKDSGISMSEGPRLRDAKSLESSYKNVFYSWVSPLQGSGQQELVLNEKPLFIAPCTSTDDYHPCGNEVPRALPALGTNSLGFPLPNATVALCPFMVTDLEYRPCENITTGASLEEDLSSAPTSELHNDLGRPVLPFDTPILDDDYQSFTSAINKVSLDVDELNKDKLVCSVNPAYAGLQSRSCSLDQSEEGYQALQSVAPSNKVQQQVMKHGEEEGEIRHDGGMPWHSKSHIIAATALPIQSAGRPSADPLPCTAFDSPPAVQIINDHHYHKV
ncbi:uncharacterized protein LOC108932964 [Arapaima gigas]